jgi:hypothetical protein
MRRCRVAAVGALACALVLAGYAGRAGAVSCSSPAGSAACAVSQAPPLVTTRQAADAIEALWQVRERALRKGDVALLAEIETGTALAADRYEAMGTRCCWRKSWTKAPRRYLRAILNVSRQSRYPLVFAAQVVVWRGPNTDPWKATAMFVVIRPGPDEPWRIASIIYDMRYGAPIDPFPAPRMDLRGYELCPAKERPRPRRRAGSRRSWTTTAASSAPARCRRRAGFFPAG